MKRLPGLDLLRAVAIVWVMLFHSYLIGGLGPHWQWLERFGWMGVDLFFALSGFLIGRQVLAPLARGERLDFGDFYLRRALRVLPALWVVLVLYLAFPTLRERPGLEPWWKFVSFLYNVMADYRNLAFSQVWSLCVEEHFYLLFPVLAVVLVPRLHARGFLTLCAALVLVGILLRAGIWVADNQVSALEASTRNWFVEDLYYPTWCRSDGLLGGVMLAALQVFHPDLWRRWQQRTNTVLVAGLMLVGLAMGLFSERTGLIGNAVGWPIVSAGMGLLVLAGADRNSLISRLRVPGVSWLAQASYSLYLTHKIAFGLVERAFGSVLEGHMLLAFIVYASATLAAGALLHYAVERPGLRLRMHWQRSRTAVTVAPASSD